MIKNKEEKFIESVDFERSDGVFLPLESRSQKKQKKQVGNVKEFILENIESVLDEIIDEIDKER